MATSFLGLPVLVKLRSAASDSVQGILSSLDPASGTLTLTEARSFVGGVNRLEGIRVLSRSEVAGLELLSVQRGKELEAQDSHSSPSAPERAAQPTKLHRSSAQLPSPVPSPARLSLSERTPSGRSQKRKQQQPSRAIPSPRPSAQHSPQPSSRIDGDFDFSAGLASFDKKAIFADIKSQDATDPSSRLHAHNRNPSSRVRTPQSKLLPSESVLSPQELYNQQQEVQTLRDNRRTKIASMTPTDMHAGDVEESLGGAEGEDQRNERRWQNVTDGIERIALNPPDRRSDGGGEGGGEGGEQILTASGRPVPVVKEKQWREALSIAEIESSLSSTQRLEASSAALLQHICSERLVPLPAPPHARPTVCVLASDSDRGYVALRAAATLAYRGCRVAVLVPATVGVGPDADERFRTAVRVISSAGARIIREVEDLPQSCVLVIDALDSHSRDSDAVQASIDWANSLQGAFVLALDVPTGVDPDSGATLSLKIKTPLRPSGILAFGLPRPCLATDLARHPSSSSSSSTSSSGGSTPGRRRISITLADVGFPPAIWDRVGVEGYDAQIWGAELLVGLEPSRATP